MLHSEPLILFVMNPLTPLPALKLHARSDEYRIAEQSCQESCLCP